MQDFRALAFAQSREQHDLTAGEFQRVVMNVRLVVIDLTEPRHFLPDFSVREEGAERRVVFHVALERELGARKQAHRHVRVVAGGEAAGDRIVEFRRYEFVADLGGPGCDVLQTVVTHRRFSSGCDQRGCAPCL